MIPCKEQCVFVIAGPAGSGKDSVIRGLKERYKNIDIAVNYITRRARPGEVDGVHYYFIENEEFLRKLACGDIPEHYYRKATNTYYGLNKNDVDARLDKGRVVAMQLQIVGAKYVKEAYGATTIFIEPSLSSDFEKRMRERSPMSDAEWKEREAFTKREIVEEAVWYDYRIVNEDGKLEETISHVVRILQKEGYVLE